MSSRSTSSESGWRRGATGTISFLQRELVSLRLPGVGADILGSKYTSYGKTREGSTYPYAGVNQVGNAKKNLKNTVEQSLKRLRTSYLDILYVSA
jgi:hypothetical protein